MKSLLIAIATILAFAATAAAAQSAQEAERTYEVTPFQMNIINETLSNILPDLGEENIFSILITRIDESGQDLPDQLVQVSESIRMTYASASTPPTEACLTRFTKAQTWFDSGTFLRNYLCQHSNYNGPDDPANRNLRHDIYWGTSTSYFNTADPVVECMVSGKQNPVLNSTAFQKLCFQRIQ